MKVPFSRTIGETHRPTMSAPFPKAGAVVALVLALAPFAASADAGDVSYLDWDEPGGAFTTAVARAGAYVVVAEDTSRFADGAVYVVTGAVETGRISVEGSARLVLADGATLSAFSSEYGKAGINVPTNSSLTICAPADANGAVFALGDVYGAGIGGNIGQGCGAVTINGGMVLAGTGSSYGMGGAAGIGGGIYGAGGRVTVNGGKVMAWGMNAESFGSGTPPSPAFDPGVTVIRAGLFAMPVAQKWIDAESVGFPNVDSATRDGFPVAVCRRADACVITFGEHAHMDVCWTTGDGTRTQNVERTETAVCLPRGTDGVAVTFTPHRGYAFDGGDASLEFDLPPLSGDVTFGEGALALPPLVCALEDVPYCDWDPASRTLVDATLAASDYSVFDQTVTEFRDGWYVAGQSMTCGTIRVTGQVHLVIPDGVELRAEGSAGLLLSHGSELTVYGQSGCGGKLTAIGADGPGLGGAWDGRSSDPGVKVTINGGCVAALSYAFGSGRQNVGLGGGSGTGTVVTVNAGVVLAQAYGVNGAGIGGSLTVNGGDVVAAALEDAEVGVDPYPYGIVTVNGGILTTEGCDGGAAIGGNQWSDRPAPAVEINGGTVVAHGGKNGGAGIGGSFGCGGVNVTISGGRIRAEGGGGAPAIGAGAGGCETSGSTRISGGLFGFPPRDEWLAGGCFRCDTTDPSVRGDYPFEVRSDVCRVTIGEMHNLTAAWTFGGGELTNDVRGASFFVPTGMIGVKVIFTPADGYALVGNAAVDLGTVSSDLAFGSEPLVVPGTVKTGDVAYRTWNPASRRLVGAVLPAGSYTPVTAATTTLGNGWYVVDSDVSRGQITVSGQAHLVLADGRTLTVSGGKDQAGIRLTAGNSLTVYGQDAGTGALVAYGGESCAGIGGNECDNAGELAINGGRVTASSALLAPGIGGGYDGNAGLVTVNGGFVDARNEKVNGVGIGGSYLVDDVGRLVMNGGTVRASGGWQDVNVGLTVNGGNLAAQKLRLRKWPTNDRGDQLHLAAIFDIPDHGGQVNDGRLEVNGLTDYGVEDIWTTDGRLYFFLPEGTHWISVCSRWFEVNAEEDFNAKTREIPEPRSDSASVKLNRKGELEVCPENESVDEVEIGDHTDGMPVSVPVSVNRVVGVPDEQIVVRSKMEGEDVNITGAFAIRSGEIALNPEGEVELGGETIPVRPVIGLAEGESAEESPEKTVLKSLMASAPGDSPETEDASYSVDMKTIPGLTYELLRSATLDNFKPIGVKKTATGTSMKLTDSQRLKGRGFYRIDVSK